MSNPVSLAALFALVSVCAITSLVVLTIQKCFLVELNDDDRKVHTLDGVRGIVALGVVMHHSVITYLAFANPKTGWGAPSSNFQNQLGSASVSIFFMISAYLFCGSLIKNKGNLSAFRLAESRVVRIVPLYAVVVCLTVLFAFWQTDFHLMVTPAKLAANIARISLFDFVRHYEVNTVNVDNLISQTWTLRYEWMLYGLLPLIAVAMRRTGAVWPMFAVLVLCTVADQLFAFFLAGAASSVVVRKNGPRAIVMWQIAGLVGLAIVAIGFHDSRGWLQAALMTPFFVAVLQGRFLMAALAWRPLRFLGVVSYSIYLLHGFSLWMVSRLIIGTSRFAGMDEGSLVGFLLLSGFMSVIFGCAGYFIVERPLMGWRPFSKMYSKNPPRTERAQTA